MSRMVIVDIDGSQLKLPRNIVESLVRYIDQGTPTGGFLNSVLANDLVGAVNRADSFNTHYLKEITQVCMWCLPAKAWGSYDKVDVWVDYALNNKTLRPHRDMQPLRDALVNEIH